MSVVNNTIPRPEHPNPQCQRESWVNLNGWWDFCFDFGASGISRKFYENPEFTHKIQVPFCVESELGGIAHKDFIPCCWYRRFFDITQEQLEQITFIHFDAVDYEAHVFINGVKVGVHKGGYASFKMDITSFVKKGANEVLVCVYDDGRSKNQPRGKQSSAYYSHGCDYTRTTGIWQTVWLEFVPKTHIKNFRFYPNVSESSLTIQAEVVGDGILSAEASFNGNACGAAEVKCENGNAMLYLQLTETHLWQVGEGNLYDLTLKFGEDTVQTYFGLREVKMDGYKFRLNGKSVFQRTILDQGFYPDGIYTAPTDADLIKDIELSFAAGFNGARLHEKVFEPRFLYHCDRLGYLVWGEYPNWGLDHTHPLATEIYLNEWSEAIERDFNHPAIIGWCPFNETWGYFEDKEKNALISSIYKLTKRLDPTRPCIDASGNHRVISEVYDIHDYNQNPEFFKNRWDNFTELIKEKGGKLPLSEDFFRRRNCTSRDGTGPFFDQPYDNQPIFISEYGGIRWVDESIAGWGYGNAPKDAEEFFARYKGLTEAMLFNENIFGFCYTQLYDIEQEVNGLYTYERKQKFDINIIKAINEQKAAIED